MRAIMRLLHRFAWMFKVKDCRHICLFCKYYQACTIDGAAERREKRVNLKYAARSEDTEQITVIQWAQCSVNRYPELKWLFHCPNGGSRNQKEAVKLKQMGVKAGVSDLCLPYPKGIFCCLFIEMKFGDNRQQASQKEFLKDMEAAGHFVATCYSAEEAIGIITEYCELGEVFHQMPDDGSRHSMQIPNNSIFKDGKVKGGGSR